MGEMPVDETRRALAALLARTRRMGGAGWSETLEAARVLAQPSGSLRRVRHRKRGSKNEVLGQAEAQVSTGDDGKPIGLGLVRQRSLVEGSKLTVYRAPQDGRLFVRFPDEFEDGRFEEMPNE